MSLSGLLISHQQKHRSSGAVDATLIVSMSMASCAPIDAFKTIQKRKSAIHARILDETQAHYEALLSTLINDIVSDSSTAKGEETMISYDEFMVYNSKIFDNNEKMATLCPHMYLMLPKSKDGTISLKTYKRVILRHLQLNYLSIELMRYSKINCTHHITESELESFMCRFMREIATYFKLEENFYMFYVYYCVRKFVFFVDPNRSLQLSIDKLVHSVVMDELLCLYEYVKCDTPEEKAEHEFVLLHNYFSPQNSMQVYEDFLELDEDKNGTLSKGEFLKYSSDLVDNMHLTTIAVDRIFSENMMCKGLDEMDYKMFLDFVIAYRYRQTKEAIKYFMRVINNVDIDRTGEVTMKTINYFYSDIKKILVANNYEPPSDSNITSEVLDLISSGNGGLKEVLACKQGHVVTTLLLDVNSFWRYDNREALGLQ